MTKFAAARTVSAALALAAVAFGMNSAAYAGGGKEVFIQDYSFAKPMHGYSGHSGNFYCDYQRIPVRRCLTSANGVEVCRIVSWTLREMCQ